MGLIVLALVQALVYNIMCSRKEAEFARLESLSGDDSSTSDDPDTGSGPASSES